MPNLYNFQKFFTLNHNFNNKSNAKAVCRFCSLKHEGTQAAALISGCYITNKSILCYSHLANYVVNDDNATISRPIKYYSSSISTVTSIASSMSNQQVSLYNYCRRPISQKNIPIFETLVIRMCISNILPFSFVENEKTQAVFDFVVPNHKLPTQKRIEISLEQSQTEDVIWHIENLMNKTQSKNVKLNAFLSDSAGEYTAASTLDESGN
ncbi:hypothetical protein F8M41_000123 [Gigaspora margarita]|uniref:Uncharacterized protein n=1 Tax=Gigaspora margarita TaxID=4874 RepID=A0A8H4B4X8_GIGMA|nr:hypothetical protein F8M41_000123 [Gigaspora margarita]